jgi:hypothetical protein
MPTVGGGTRTGQLRAEAREPGVNCLIKMLSLEYLAKKRKKKDNKTLSLTFCVVCGFCLTTTTTMTKGSSVRQQRKLTQARDGSGDGQAKIRHE